MINGKRDSLKPFIKKVLNKNKRIDSKLKENSK
ncbi:hypothetical protein CLV62_12322 [Dysgonomonas alginatilytica]|uniref:Uncharacterized protein n=1 Tax=Dysgonomonas alginatilytica TaxID=1605892 RepID=A0A2V3PLB4_9BACT|nr:hypothetical protein CLV62_12322 [Dysgonomonas alginatilytica]